MSYIQLPYSEVIDKNQNYKGKHQNYIHKKAIAQVNENELEMKSIHESLKLVVTDGKLNDAIIRHVLDTKDKHILADPNPLQVTFRDIKIFDALNPIIGKVLTQIETSTLSDKNIKEQLGQLKVREIEA